ncbi:MULTISPECIES: transcriptional regulator [unclassified Streptomyces]|uniref:winged helix-turn-helix domain-containing protein n=1 Tax=Streptomyces TaxID=1883 RepID=UPI0001C193C9|nr:MULTISPECIES: transcriptional regulator [unclassified Streptomyces]AEN14032.1 regulatory protein ArsR [Streptomyces sp. SirexAA-E]MYR67739.1 winged helix DNA-binding protein [Streptomyces sp. SID4939]MYR99422.1 winged helix DNA-binding protein [Streptomyces sp. SID4940]MYT67920.1 winged helix DNA-binding protein [Streptomyces sp. SID8357]MYT86763.1 winged helix DNA-binding protein [Streptomyces sp. SID8360]
MDDGFNEFLHVPARLAIVALLAPTSWTEFGFLRDAIPTSDSALSKHLSSLAAKGYVEVRKDKHAGGRRTLIRLTPDGRQEFRRHAAALERIVATARAPQGGEPDG